MWRAGGRVRRDRGRATFAPRHRKAREGDGCGGSAEVSLMPSRRLCLVRVDVEGAVDK